MRLHRKALLQHRCSSVIPCDFCLEIAIEEPICGIPQLKTIPCDTMFNAHDNRQQILNLYASRLTLTLSYHERRLVHANTSAVTVGTETAMAVYL